MSNLRTHFASAERQDLQSVLEKRKKFIEGEVMRALLEVMPGYILVLNKDRQLIHANKRFLNFIQAPYEEIVGKRPGEIFNCINSDGPGGCGTSKKCRQCGSCKSILAALEHSQGVEENYYILTKKNNAYEFTAESNTYDYKGSKFIFMSLIDISDQKRRQALEMTLFQDINNILGLVMNYSEQLQVSCQQDELGEPIEKLSAGLNKMAKSLASKQDLFAAEDEDLSLHFTDVKLEEFLLSISEAFIEDPSSEGKAITLQSKGTTKKLSINTDPFLLRKVVENMLKNALEATEDGESVKLKYEADADNVRISVHNYTYIPEDIQLSIFQRSFSTKGQGRGYGTYSMKLFGEKYLGGIVDFTSDEKKGTTFFITLPRELPKNITDQTWKDARDTGKVKRFKL